MNPLSTPSSVPASTTTSGARWRALGLATVISVVTSAIAVLASPIAVGNAAARDRDGRGDDQRASRYSAKEKTNIRAVRRAYHDQNNGGNVFDLLDREVVWSIASGNTYHSKREFIVEGSTPVVSRLDTHIEMTIVDLWADDNTVVVHFTGEATAKDGLPYRNEFTWIFTLRDQKAVKVKAFLDLRAVEDLIDRVPQP